MSQSYTVKQIEDNSINGNTHEEETPEEEGQGRLLNEAHTSPGLQGSTAEIARKQGIPVARAGAILAAGARKAGPAAIKANPRLKKVRGV